jgi:hypothetical protein
MLQHVRPLLLAAALLNGPAVAQCWDQHLVAGTTDFTLPSAVALGPGRLAFGQPRRNPTGSPSIDDIVRVFEGAPGSMTEVAALTSSLSVQSNASFGTALDMAGDWLAIGDPSGFDASFGGGGAVHLYERTLAGWTLRQVLSHPTVGIQFRGNFGASLDLDGDLLVVGSPFATVTTTQAIFETGAAFVFERGPAGWQFLQTIVSPNVQLFGAFGASVALAGELLAIGASGEQAVPVPPIDRSGTVHVFCRCAGTQFSPLAALRAAQPVPDANLGWSVAIHGRTVVAGAPGEEVSGLVNGGRVYVFDQSPSGAWIQSAALEVPPIREYQQFGDDVELHGNELYVTAAGMAAAWRFVRNGGAWVQAQRYTTEAGVAWPIGLAVRVRALGDIVVLTDPEGATVFPRVQAASAETGCVAVPVPGTIPLPVYLDVRSEQRLSLPTLQLSVIVGSPVGNGILFYGFAPASVPLGTGVRCVGGPLARAAIGIANPASTTTPLTLALHAPPVSSGALAITAGVDVHLQYWFRTAGGSSHLTNSLVLAFCP